MPLRRIGTALAAAGALSCSVPGAARAEDGRALVVFPENDIFAGWDGDYTDRHYTAGNYAFLRRGEGRVSPWARRLLAGPLGWGEGRDEALVESWGFGQALFAPEDLLAEDPDPRDRPYAGWLRLMYVLSRAHDGVVDTFSLDAGWVGPAALGEQVHKAFHHAIGEEIPQGYDHQLGNEPAFHVTLERKWARLRAAAGPLDADLRPVTRATLGNTFVQAAAGIEARLGAGLVDDYGPPRPGPANPYPGFTRKSEGTCACYVFAAVEAHYAARDLFIEGNTFGGRKTGLDLEPWVGELRAGVALDRGRWGAGFTHILRTEEFEGQMGSEQLGIISLTRRF